MEPKSHGLLAVQEQPKPKPPWIPKALRDITIVQFGGMSPEEERSKYGVWKMRCLKTVCLCGRIMNEGDTFQTAGNNALSLALGGPSGPDAEFLDEDGQKAKEEALARAAREMSLPVNYQAAPQFSEFPDAAVGKRRKHILS